MSKDKKTKKSTDKDNFFLVEGKITKKEKGRLFVVETDDGKEISSELCARFRNEYGKKRAKIVLGDRVVVEVTVKDLKKGQIVGIAKK